ncbi:DNA translocase FtsK [Bacillus swezeyi]|uniref:DNA translocase FtsK n=1 Tax=Bacillus swezeyi TaxID=1925020 RepID=A0A5M8RNW3_9BACI|nr:DNA translocase FtsK [Bacillus swezeyi]KAA6448564.1 DNA translocase FtsK [Bacillus swezeyi]TYS34875.1 DNA translocase FtsK [Bacillus swezeyi]
MSWFNKMFSLFLGDDENSEKQTKQTDESVSASSFEENEELPQISDAKVVYEYPKGKFRFPVIPDHKSQQREKSAGRQARSRRSDSHPSAYQPTSGFSNEEVKKSAKKPFRPSVIPSPVYGFNEQKKVRPNDLPKNEPYSGKNQKEAHVTLFTEEIKKEQDLTEKKPPSAYQDTALSGTNKKTEETEQHFQTEEVEKAERFSETKKAAQQDSGQEDAATGPLNDDKETHQLAEEVLVQQEIAAAGPLNSTEKAAKSVHSPLEAEETEEEFAEQDHFQQGANTEMPIGRKGNEIGQPRAAEAEKEPAQEEQERAQEEAPPEKFSCAAEAEEIDQLPAEGIEKSQSFFKETQSSAYQASDITVQEEPSAESIGAPEKSDAAMSSRPEALSEDEEPPAEEDKMPEEPGQSESKSANRQNDEEVQQHDKVKADQIDSGHHGRQSEAGQANDKADEAPSASLKQKTKAAPKSQQGSVPFNVMMLSSDKQKEKISSGYQFPNMSLLDIPPAQKQDDHAWINEQRELLDVTLENFNVKANVVHVTQGPSVTRFEVHPEPGVKVNKITNLSDDIKLSLSAKDIRIEAPIPGKNTIGIEVPNLHSKMVYLREMIRSPEFRTNPSPLTAAFGLDISGKPVVADLKKMPHGLIAGATGSGKSVCINTILVSLLFKAGPSEVKLLLIDPKMVELAPYNEIPHLVSPVITDAKAATAALKWVVEEMERRYELFAHSGVREIERFNEKVHEKNMGEKLPYLVVVIDELADLMMVAPNEVEESICRIAQKARACGIHLLIATQRPSVDVITGLIKANIPTRIAFSVSSGVDSRTIIDMAGAEKLLGKGDMLFLENGSGKPVRLQGNFVSDHEIDRVVSHVRQQQKPSYLFEQEELVRQNPAGFDQDELFLEACEFTVEQNSASTSSLQRRFRIGYNRAARLIDMMEREGMISEAKGSKPREVLMTKADLEQLIESSSLFS